MLLEIVWQSDRGLEGSGLEGSELLGKEKDTLAMVSGFGKRGGRMRRPQQA